MRTWSQSIIKKVPGMAFYYKLVYIPYISSLISVYQALTEKCRVLLTAGKDFKVTELQSFG